MKQFSKIISVIVLILAIISISLSVNAYTNNDVISYVTKVHIVNGRKAQLDKAQRQSLTTYLKENPVTDQEADEIIAKLDKAKALIDNSGATNLSQLSNSIKAEVVSLIKAAGAIAELDVEVDTVKETVTVKARDGRIIIGATSYSQFNTTPNADSSNSSNSSNSTSSGKLVYTGNTGFSTGMKASLAIVAIAIITFVRKNRYAK